MKKYTLSIAACALMGTLAMAGGDIAPVEPVVDTPVVAAVQNGFYVGTAYGYMGDEYTRSPNTMDPKSFDESYSAWMFQAGYKINNYIAVEGRYWASMSDISVKNQLNQGYDLQGADAWGLYVKPMYPVTDAIDIYALLGYASMDHNSKKLNDGDGFSWGLGASYGVTENIDLFVDYVSIYDDDRSFSGVTKDITIDSVNFGVTYNF